MRYFVNRSLVVTAARTPNFDAVLRKNPFIRPMAPVLAKMPPIGPDWIHEVKFDGWRAQVHVEDGSATIYSRNGADLTRQFRALKPVIDAIPAKSAIIDCELVACDDSGLPCFRSLMDHRDVQLRGDGLAGLPDLELVRVPARVGHRPGRAHRRAEAVGELLDDAEPVGRPGAAPAGDHDLRLGQVRPLALLRHRPAR